MLLAIKGVVFYILMLLQIRIILAQFHTIAIQSDKDDIFNVTIVIHMKHYCYVML